MNHAECRERFVDALYGDLSDSTLIAFHGHLDGCPECKAAFNDLSSVSRVMNQRTRPEMSQQEWTAFWNRLSASIEQVNNEPTWADRWSWLTSLAARPSIRTVGAAAVILIIGILIGRTTSSPSVDDDADEQLAPTAVERVALESETMKYLDRSKILLLGIMNAGPSNGEDVRLLRPQERSRRLVTEGAALRVRLNEPEYRQLGALVDDLEVLLLQIANLQAENNFPGIEIIRDGVKRKGILLKINLEQMRSALPRERPRTEPAHTQQRSSI